jgi:endoglucanase
MMDQCDLDRVRGLIFTIFSTILLHGAVSQAALEFTGVNLSGAEFGVSTGQTGPNNLPGTFGTQYTYPTKSEVDYFTGKGMNIFRLPFRWERLQPTPNAALNPTELSRMDAFVNYATSKGADVILDPHNFERYYPSLTQNFQSTTAGLIGGTVANSKGVVVTNAMFANLWSQLATHYAGNSRVQFGLMNEPDAMPEATLIGSENAAIAAIRATGAQNTILVPGNAFTGAWTWTNQNNKTNPATDTSNAAGLLGITGITNPANNIVVEMHQYMDSNGSGTSAAINNNDPLTGVERLTAATAWLKTNGIKGFLGEFGVDNSIINGANPNDPSTLGNEVLNNMIQYMEANSDAWTGFAAWGGGPWWANNSLFHIDPVNGQDEPIMDVLQQYLVGVPEPSSLALMGGGFILLSLKRRAKSV